jgi:hypothetical protein
MEILTSVDSWAVTDSENLEKFLSTPTGQRLIPKLAELTPELLAAGDTNAVLIRSGEVRGVNIVIATLLTLAHPTKQDLDAGTVTEYPSLDNDKAWEDGQTLDPEPEPPKLTS